MVALFDCAWLGEKCGVKCIQKWGGECEKCECVKIHAITLFTLFTPPRQQIG